MNCSKLIADRNICVLVSLDMQDKVINLTWDRDIVRPRAAALTSIARLFDVPVIKVEHVPSKMGGTAKELNDITEDLKPISKTTFSAFKSDEFNLALKSTGRTQIIIFGVEAHVCLCQTVLDAISSGYQVFVVADASSSTSPYHRDISYDRMRHAGAIVATAQSLAFELAERADTPEFKQALPFIKDL